LSLWEPDLEGEDEKREAFKNAGLDPDDNETLLRKATQDESAPFSRSPTRSSENAVPAASGAPTPPNKKRFPVRRVLAAAAVVAALILPEPPSDAPSAGGTSGAYSQSRSTSRPTYS